MVKRYKRHITVFEKGTAIILWGFLGVAVVTQLFYGIGAELLIAVFAFFALLFTYLVFLPVEYELNADELVVISSATGRTQQIPFSQIIDCDTIGSFRLSKRDFDAVEAIITYHPDGKKRKKTISCHPKNVTDFVQTLYVRVPHLTDDPSRCLIGKAENH